MLGLIERSENELTATIEQDRSPVLGWLSCDKKGKPLGGVIGSYRDALPQAIAAGRYGPEKKTVLNYRGWPATIVSNQGDSEIRRFLRERGYRTKAAGWNPEAFEGFAYISARASFYEVRGDAGLVARRDIQARITFGDLAMVVTGLVSLKTLLHRSKDRDVPEVSSGAAVIAQGRETL